MGSNNTHSDAAFYWCLFIGCSPNSGAFQSLTFAAEWSLGTPRCAKHSNTLLWLLYTSTRRMLQLKTLQVRPFAAAAVPPRRVACRVSKDQPNPFGDGPAAKPSTSAGTSVDDAAKKEAELELLEASVRKNKRAMAAAKKAIPIKGMVNQPKQDNSNMAEWPEGQLLPNGWDQMPLPEKMSELYLGRRGVLFWANKAAYASVIILAVAWVAFRFVGPNLGLYTLQGDLMPPPM